MVTRHTIYTLKIQRGELIDEVAKEDSLRRRGLHVTARKGRITSSQQTQLKRVCGKVPPKHKQDGINPLQLLGRGPSPATMPAIAGEGRGRGQPVQI